MEYLYIIKNPEGYDIVEEVSLETHKIFEGTKEQVSLIEKCLINILGTSIDKPLYEIFRVIRSVRDRVLAKKSILILVPHDDDATISFAGLIIKERQKGNFVHVHEFTVGGPCSNVGPEIRQKEFQNAMRYLHVSKYTWSGIGMDGKLDTIPNCSITGYIDKLIELDRPDEVYCAANSEHKDHSSLYSAFLGSCRLKSGWNPKLYAVGVYMFSTQLYMSKEGGKIFNPLSEEVYQKKLKSFKKSASQFKPSPSPLGEDGLRIMSEYYGMMCGHKYAEMYYQLRYIRSYDL